MTILASIITAFFAVGFCSASSEAPAQGSGVLQVLHAGQTVSIKESNSRYEIGVFENAPAPLTYKVIEVGDDYFVVQDAVGATETRIPIFSIKAVVTLKIRK